MSFRVLVSERTGTLAVADTVTATLGADIIAPEVLGDVSKQDAYYNALVVKEAHVVWSVLPIADLPSIEAILTVQHYAVGGGWSSSNFTDTWPSLTQDVSGQLMLNRGTLDYDGTVDGVFRAQLALTNYSGGTLDLAYRVSVWGVVPDERQPRSYPSQREF